MNYEIVELKDMQVVGVGARTNNTSPDMGMIIGGLWERFYGTGIYAGIQNKVNEKALGIYSEYENNETGDYTITVACAVNETSREPEGTVSFLVPAGKYAKFIVKGNMNTVVSQFWQELWSMNLQRTYVCDFEEYQNSDMEQAEIHMYIGVK